MEMDWRSRAFLVGGVLGALLGLGAAYIYINAAEQSGETPEVSPGTAVTIGLSLLALLRQVADPGSGEGARWANMRMHRVVTDMLARFGASSKLNAEWEFVTMLFGEGRRAANDFLKTNGQHLGKRSTADLDMLLTEC